MTKKIIFLFTFGAILLFPVISFANGLVPDCGGAGQDPCTLCHFFLMFQNIINFVLFTLAPIIAILMLVIGGFMFFFAGGSPEMLSKSKSIITSTVIGLIIIYVAWLIVNTFLIIIGVEEWTGLAGGWFRICCPGPCP